jgi:hypothetical protein
MEEEKVLPMVMQGYSKLLTRGIPFPLWMQKLWEKALLLTLV